MPLAEFWDQTPAETYQTIEAYWIRQDSAWRQAVGLAWLNAKLTRAKRVPPLKQLLAPKKARVLKGPELDRRRAEFAGAKQAANLDKLTDKLNKKAKQNGGTRGSSNPHKGKAG